MKISRSTKLRGIRLLLYPVVIAVFFIIKNLVIYGEIHFSKDNLNSLIYISVLLYVLDTFSALIPIIKNSNYLRQFLGFIILLIISVLFLNGIAVKIELNTVLFLVLNISIAWLGSYLIVKKLKM